MVFKYIDLVSLAAFLGKSSIISSLRTGEMEDLFSSAESIAVDVAWNEAYSFSITEVYGTLYTLT